MVIWLKPQLLVKCAALTASTAGLKRRSEVIIIERFVSRIVGEGVTSAKIIT